MITKKIAWIYLNKIFFVNIIELLVYVGHTTLIRSLIRASRLGGGNTHDAFRIDQG
jgi:hypothetical protein